MKNRFDIFDLLSGGFELKPTEILTFFWISPNSDFYFFWKYQNAQNLFRTVIYRILSGGIFFLTEVSSPKCEVEFVFFFGKMMILSWENVTRISVKTTLQKKFRVEYDKLHFEKHFEHVGIFSVQFELKSSCRSVKKFKSIFLIDGALFYPNFFWFVNMVQEVFKKNVCNGKS